MLRVGEENMMGIDRLIAGRHNGIAERHTVEKLITYVRQLEKQLNINIPKIIVKNINKHYRKVSINGVSHSEITSSEQGFQRFVGA